MSSARGVLYLHGLTLLQYCGLFNFLALFFFLLNMHNPELTFSRGQPHWLQRRWSVRVSLSRICAMEKLFSLLYIGFMVHALPKPLLHHVPVPLDMEVAVRSFRRQKDLVPITPMSPAAVLSAVSEHPLV